MAASKHKAKHEKFKLKKLGKKTGVDEKSLSRFDFSGVECWAIKPTPTGDPVVPISPNVCTGQLLPLTLPGRCTRITEEEFKDPDSKPQAYGEWLVGEEKSTDSYLLWLINEPNSNVQTATTNTDSIVYDFCDVKGLIATGQGEPCVMGIDTLAVQWHYSEFISALGGKSRLGNLARKEFKTDTIKMIATVAPNRTIIWIPAINGEDANDLYDTVKAKSVFTAFGVTYLDGPNIFVGRRTERPWFNYQP